MTTHDELVEDFAEELREFKYGTGGLYWHAERLAKLFSRASGTGQDELKASLKELKRYDLDTNGEIWPDPEGDYLRRDDVLNALPFVDAPSPYGDRRTLGSTQEGVARAAQIFKRHGEVFPHYLWEDARTTVDLMAAEILTLRDELARARAGDSHRELMEEGARIAEEIDRLQRAALGGMEG